VSPCRSRTEASDAEIGEPPVCRGFIVFGGWLVLAPPTGHDQLRRRGPERIARRHRRAPAQVLPRWCIEQRVPVIPKSTHRERIAENAQLFDFRLPEEDIAGLDALDRTGGTGRALERKWWRS